MNGAMAAIRQVSKREAKTKKDLWIQNLVDRRGKKCVALANKTVRTAFAIQKTTLNITLSRFFYNCNKLVKQPVFDITKNA